MLYITFLSGFNDIKLLLLQTLLKVKFFLTQAGPHMVKSRGRPEEQRQKERKKKPPKARVAK